MMKKKGYAKGGMKKKGYAAGGLKMVKNKEGDMVPFYAADGKGKMYGGGMAMKKKKPSYKVQKERASTCSTCSGGSSDNEMTSQNSLNSLKEAAAAA